jgi:hypothetical protein
MNSKEIKIELRNLIESIFEESGGIQKMIFDRIEEKSSDKDVLEINIQNARSLHLIFDDREDSENHAYDLGYLECLYEIRSKLISLEQKIKE